MGLKTSFFTLEHYAWKKHAINFLTDLIHNGPANQFSTGQSWISVTI